MQICPSCFAQESDDAKFCGLCGKALVDIKASATTLVGVVLDDKYVIRELIARGGMGEVYQAEHTKLRQKVAVKILNRRYRGDETVVKRFFNEAASYCRVSHPNAVKIHDFGKLEDDTLYMIMEFVPGETLTRHLARLGPLGNRRTLQLGMQLADVLLAAHSQGVVHRDLKPDNLMLVEVSPGRHQLKVLDFGIAKFLDDTGGEQLTETNLIFGTPEFMSPEQAQGFDVDHRADIYAFGMLLYYMVTANLPFHGGAKLSILNRQVHEAPKRPSEIAPKVGVLPDLEAIIMKCIEKARQHRYESFTPVLDDLERVAAGQPPSISATSRVPLGQRPTGAPQKDGATNVFDSSPLVRLTSPEQTVRRADPLQAMFDRAPGRGNRPAAAAASPSEAATVVRENPHEAETRVARTGGHAIVPRLGGGRPAPPSASDSALELGDLDATIADSGPIVLGSSGSNPRIGASAPRILGAAPEITVTAPRILGDAPPASDSGPFVITPEPPSALASDPGIPIVIADASRPGRPVDEDVVTGEQPIVEVEPAPAIAPRRAQRGRGDDDGPAAFLSLSEAAGREDGPRLLGGPDDDGDGFSLGDAPLLTPEELDLGNVRPYERRGSGAIIGLVLLLLAVGGAALWFFVLRQPAASSDAATGPSAETRATAPTDGTVTDDGTPAPTPDDAPTDGSADTAPVADALPPLPAPAALDSKVRALAAIRLLETTAAEHLEQGDFEAADKLLRHVEKRLKDDLDDLHAREIGALVNRHDTAAALFKTASKDAKRERCGDAEEALLQLEPLSAGAAATLREAVTKCRARLAAPPSRVE